MGEITVFFYWTVYTIYEQDTTFCGCSNTMDFPAKEEKQKKAKQVYGPEKTLYLKLQAPQ